MRIDDAKIRTRKRHIPWAGSCDALKPSSILRPGLAGDKSVLDEGPAPSPVSNDRVAIASQAGEVALGLATEQACTWRGLLVIITNFLRCGVVEKLLDQVDMR
jgi:hypothetical protein